MEVIREQVGYFRAEDLEAIEIVEVAVTVRLEGADGCGYFVPHGRKLKPTSFGVVSRGGE